MTTTVIRNSDWIVGYDASAGGHAYATGDVAFTDNKLTHVGGKFTGPADREIDGRTGMDEALRVVAAAQKHPSGRLSGMVIPSQIDTCSAELFRDSYAESLRLKVPFQTHAAQSIVEFHEMTRRHGMTPIEWL